MPHNEVLVQYSHERIDHICHPRFHQYKRKLQFYDRTESETSQTSNTDKDSIQRVDHPNSYAGTRYTFDHRVQVYNDIYRRIRYNEVRKLLARHSHTPRNLHQKPISNGLSSIGHTAYWQHWANMDIGQRHDHNDTPVVPVSQLC